MSTLRRLSSVAAIAAACALLLALGLLDPHGRGAFLTGLLDALVSWPLAAIAVVVLLLPQLRAVLSKLDLSKPLTFTSPLASLAVGGPQGDVRPPEAERPEEPTQVPAQSSDAERARHFEALAKQWHFAFLAQVLRPHTINVLRWLQLRGPLPESVMWIEWGRFIPDLREQGAVLSALVDANLVSRTPAGGLAVTSYGAEFSDWHLREFSSPPRNARGGNPPFIAYGSGVSPGAVVSAVVRGFELSRASAGPDGFWQMQILEGSPVPRDGDLIEFFLNGTPTTATEMWKAGGAPQNVAQGVRLLAA